MQPDIVELRCFFICRRENLGLAMPLVRSCSGQDLLQRRQGRPIGIEASGSEPCPVAAMFIGAMLEHKSIDR